MCFNYLARREVGIVDRRAEAKLRADLGFVREIQDQIKEFINFKGCIRRANGKGGLMLHPRPYVGDMNHYGGMHLSLMSLPLFRVFWNIIEIFFEYDFTREPCIFVRLLCVDGRVTAGTFHETVPADDANWSIERDEYLHMGCADDGRGYTFAKTFVDDASLETSGNYADRGDGSRFQTAYQLVFHDNPRAPLPHQLSIVQPGRRFYFGEDKQMRFFLSLLEKLILH